MPDDPIMELAASLAGKLNARVTNTERATNG
jgi:hypothetical protein